ncbi:MAG: hypothetical protein ABJD07_05570 [Gemmatimonadaceae bacterium]
MRRLRFCLFAAAGAALAACGGHDATGAAGNASACTSTTGFTLALAPGGVAVVNDPAKMGCMIVPAQAGASDYVIIAGNANVLGDVAWNYSLSASTVAGVAANIVAADVRLPSVVSPSIAVSPEALSLSERLEARRRADERALPLSGARALVASRASATGASTGTRGSITPGGPSVGDVLTLSVPDTVTPCTKFFTIGARVQAVTEHAIIAQDTTAPTGGFTAADFTDIANEFDRIIYPTDTLHFGSPGDIDVNGRVIILYTPRVNSETPRGSTSVLGGFFFGGDLFPKASCGQSNLAELFYLLAPDPGAVFSDARTTAGVRQATRGTIAHEFQHMINLSTRIRTVGAQNEATWLDEALAHFAEEFVGRAERGYTDVRKLAIADIADSPALSDFNAFFAQNLARYKRWLQHPADSGATSKRADVSLAVRGAAWSLLRYSADQYSGGDVASFTRRLVAGPDSGVSNLSKRAGVSFDEIVQGWLPANFTSGLTIPGLPARDTYASWDMRSAVSAISGGVYPLLVTTITDGFTTSTKSVSAAGGYYRLTSAGASPAMFVKVRAPGGTTVADPNARVIIVRLN